MPRNKYLIIFLTLIFLIVFFVSKPALAANTFLQGLTGAGKAYGDAPVSLQTYIASLVMTLLSLIGIVFVALIIYGGFLYLTSGGAEDKIKKAKGTLKNSVIGLLIVLTSYTVAYFITAQLESPGSSGVPQEFNKECQDSTVPEYNTYNCCVYRLQKSNSVDLYCCTTYSTFCLENTQKCLAQIGTSVCPN